MGDFKLGVIESRFADIIWRQEPLSSGELVKVCQQELGWKKSTTYTVLRKLCERGIFQFWKYPFSVIPITVIRLPMLSKR